jgi:cell wall-associated NlpC family hydrolase
MITQRSVTRVLLGICLAGLTACSWDAPRPAADEAVAVSAGDDVGSRAVRVALGQRGSPYRYGGESPAGFDCSGLVYYAYGLVGKPVPRTTRDLHRVAKPVGRESLRSGDLVFFEIDGKLSHVGIYVADDRFVHAPRRGRTVSTESLDSAFYRQAFLGGGRLP